MTWSYNGSLLKIYDALILIKPIRFYSFNPLQRYSTRSGIEDGFYGNFIFFSSSMSKNSQKPWLILYFPVLIVYYPTHIWTWPNCMSGNPKPSIKSTLSIKSFMGITGITLNGNLKISLFFLNKFLVTCFSYKYLFSLIFCKVVFLDNVIQSYHHKFAFLLQKMLDQHLFRRLEGHKDDPIED